MKPVEFTEQNHVFKKPEAMTDEQCTSLPVRVLEDGTSVSCWEVTTDELIEISQTRRVYVGVIFGGKQPPIWVAAENPFTEGVPE